MSNKSKKDKNDKPLVVTHSGSFHTDDVFAVAVLKIYLGDIEVIRTRDEDEIKKADYVVDVGGVYDPEKNRFDHHQKDVPEPRANGIPYASFGLVWKEYGQEISGSGEIAQYIDEEIIQFIDAGDNGFSPELQAKIEPYRFDEAISSLNITIEEDESQEMENFLKAVSWAKTVIEREIAHMKLHLKHMSSIVETYNNSRDKRLIIFDSPYKSSAIKEFLDKKEEPLFYVKPIKKNDKWAVRAVRVSLDSFERRKYFPESWGGKNNKELQKETGVKDALFCHKHVFICTAETKEGAIKLAKKALEN